METYKLAFLLVLGYVCLFSVTEALNPDGTCNSDSDCLLSLYHCCSGTIWCCPSGYICTGSSTCIGIVVIVGPIVGLVVLIVSIVICCICYRRRQQSAGVVYIPQATPQAQVSYGQPQPYGQPQAYGQPPPKA